MFTYYFCKHAASSVTRIVRKALAIFPRIFWVSKNWQYHLADYLTLFGVVLTKFVKCSHCRGLVQGIVHVHSIRVPS